jgi:hypothetical protein
MAEENRAEEQFLFDGMALEPAAPRPRNPNQMIGRPKGARNKLTGELHAMIRMRGINFLHKMWDRALSLWNSLSRNGHGNGAVAGELLAPRDDVREQVAGRLAGIVAARLAARAGSADAE